MNLRLLEPARQELDDAIAYYNAQVADLGDSFLIEALKVFDLIKQHPCAWHPLGDGIRWCRLNRFPYTITYSCDEPEILVLAIAHMHRKPRYWAERLKRS